MMKPRNILALLLILVLLGFIPGSAALWPSGEYTVRPGDSLSKIAAQHGTTVQELVWLNADRYPSLKTNPGLIEPGWVLVLPGGTGESTGGESLWKRAATWVQTQAVPTIRRWSRETFTQQQPAARSQRGASGNSSRASPVMQIGDRAAEEEILRMFNEERQIKGLPLLEMDEELRALAYERVRDMFQRGYFSHHDPVTGEYMGKNTAEILAQGCGWGKKDAREGARGWWRSQGHYQIITTGDFRRVGIGVGRNGSCTIIAAQFTETR